MGAVLIIALALSLDGFGVGMSYGWKRIRIPLASMCIIGTCTALGMGISMFFGYILEPRLTVISPRVLGAAVLIAVGCIQLFQAVKNRTTALDPVPVITKVSRDQDSYKTLMSIRLNLFGLVIQVLKTPDAADVDSSGIISPQESIILGIALALDTFASGMAATMTDISTYVIGLVAISQILMIWAGQALTGKLPLEILAKAKFLPGTLLVVIGSLKLI